MWGLGLLGFSSLYREGFEVVLFLRSYMLKLGGSVVLQGVILGLLFTGIAAVLTFIAHQKLPYRGILVLTGIMLGVVLRVMVGEEAQEMQLAHWIPTTQVNGLAKIVPSWMGLWFAVFPTVETLVAQGLTAAIVSAPTSSLNARVEGALRGGLFRERSGIPPAAGWPLRSTLRFGDPLQNLETRPEFAPIRSHLTSHLTPPVEAEA